MEGGGNELEKNARSAFVGLLASMVHREEIERNGVGCSESHPFKGRYL